MGGLWVACGWPVGEDSRCYLPQVLRKEGTLDLVLVCPSAIQKHLNQNSTNGMLLVAYLFTARLFGWFDVFQACNSSLERAADWLFNHVDDLDTAAAKVE